MLSIYLGQMEEAIYYPPAYFNNTYDDEWITDPLTVEMIKDVDKSEVIGPHLIESPVLGVKTLILMAFDDSGRIFNASACGNNCAKWILEIGKRKDLTINLRHIMNFGKEPFEIKILNNGEMVQDLDRFIAVAAKYV